MTKPMTSRSEIRKFLDTHYGGPTKAAHLIGLSYNTVRKWESEPELMLKYLPKITDSCEASRDDVLACIDAQAEANKASSE